jgi:hypothetical protein
MPRRPEAFDDRRLHAEGQNRKLEATPFTGNDEKVPRMGGQAASGHGPEVHIRTIRYRRRYREISIKESKYRVSF